MQSNSVSLLFFSLDDNRYAIALSSVERAYPAVAISSEGGRDTVTIAGTKIGVIDIRDFFNLAPKEVAVSDTMLVIDDNGQRSAIFVDSVGDVLEYNAEQMVIADSLLHGRAQISVIAIEGGKVVASEMREYLTRVGRNLLNLPQP